MSRSPSSRPHLASRAPASLVPPIAVPIAVALGVVAAASGCGRRDEPTPAPAAAASPPRAGGVGIAPPAVWQSTCSHCHEPNELRGRTTAQIQAAFDREPRMRPYRRRVDGPALAALERYLATLGPTPSPASNEAGPGTAYAYLPGQKCGECHPRQAAEWTGSLHALAHTEPVYDAYFVKASLDSKQQLETFCARCHTPLGVHEGTIPFARPPRRPGDTTVSAVASEGVGCDFCHTLTAPKEQQNGGYVLRPGPTKLGPYDDSSSPFHPTEGAPLYRRSEYCGPCHQVVHPTNGIVLESTFGEWQKSPYAAEGVTCQDCHMTGGLVRRQVRAGTAAEGGPRRSHVSDHQFVGPTVLFTGTGASKALAKLSRELLRRAAQVEIGDPTVHKGELRLPIRVTNVGAGHYLPTGVTEIRELWLDVTVLDGNGKPLLHRGLIGPDGALDPEAIVYRTDVADSTGALTSQFWNTVKKVRDHRLPPRQTVTEQVVLPAAAGRAAGKLTAEVALRYRSVTPAGLREVGAPADLVDIPVLTLAEVKRALTLP